MKTTSRLLLVWMLLTAPALRAAEAAPPPTWHPQNLGTAIGYMLIFTLIGVVLAILGYKLFDKCTPGDLTKEIIENKNVAAAIVAAAVILGVCLIVAAAMLG
jgi:putative membrane protein